MAITTTPILAVLHDALLFDKICYRFVMRTPLRRYATNDPFKAVSACDYDRNREALLSPDHLVLDHCRRHVALFGYLLPSLLHPCSFPDLLHFPDKLSPKEVFDQFL